jgi:hypothetical protein
MAPVRAPALGDPDRMIATRPSGAPTGSLLVLLCAGQLADLTLSVLAISRYGPGVEVNPLVGGVLSLGVVGLLAWKSAWLAVIIAAAALNPRRRTLVLFGGLLAGVIGATSGLAALL